MIATQIGDSRDPEQGEGPGDLLAEDVRRALHPALSACDQVTLFGHDVFRSLVSQAGWSVPEYKA